MKKSIFLLLLVLFASCNDEVPTQAQITAKKLASDLNMKLDEVSSTNQIFVADFKTNTTLFSGATLKVTSDGFAEVGNGGASTAILSLESLKYYSVAGGQVRLYF